MMSNNIREKKAVKEAEIAREDVKLYRLMIEFGLAIVLIFLTIIGENNGLALNHTLMSALVIVSGILFAASAVWFTIGKKKNVDSDMKVITRVGIFGNAAVLFFSAAHFYLFWDAQMLTISVIAALVMYFVYNIYGGAYFLYSIISGAGFFALLTAGKAGSTITSLATLITNGAVIATFVIPVAAVIYAIVLVAKKKLTARALVGVIITSAIILAGAVLSVMNPAAVIYTIFALIAFYLITTVAYTVKMM